MTTLRSSPLVTIFHMWWPLAGSWALMGLELPLLAATMSRLPDPAIHLAAYGGIVFPLSLLIEAPVIMILVASTALCKDWSAYQLIRNFILVLGSGLTLIHIGLAFTPLYDLVVTDVVGAPSAIVEPGRIGLQLMTPWTMAIAVRRFLQGILVRASRTRLIGTGTLIRLGISGSVLVGGLILNSVPGIVVVGIAVSSGVLAEAGFIVWCVKPFVKELKVQHSKSVVPLSLKELSNFYWPLAITPLMTLSVLPIISAALSRMPQALESLAVWPVLGGLSFVFRSVGFAFQEVVVVLCDRPHFLDALKRFAGLVSLFTSCGLFLIAVTPLSALWFESVATLTQRLSVLAQTGLFIAVIFPAISPWESFFQGQLVHRGQTTSVTQTVSLYLLGSSTILVCGVVDGSVTGLYVGLSAMVIGLLIQVMWLWNANRHGKTLVAD